MATAELANVHAPGFALGPVCCSLLDTDEDGPWNNRKGSFQFDRMAVNEDILEIDLSIQSGPYGSCEFLVEWRKTSEAKEYRSKNIHFEECGCLGLEDDEDVTEVEDGEETTKEDDVNPSFLDKSEAGITHSMTLLDVNDKVEVEAPFDEPEAPQHNEPEPNAPN
ncbi:hypothetical protein Tco_0516456 [Tanacetum coccineum]